MGAIQRYTILIMMLFVSVVAKATEPPMGVEVNGVVRDGEGNALPYVTIFVEGTTRGTTTDADGCYTLVVAESDAKLTAQMMGYETATRDINVYGNAQVDFQLAESAMAIDAVMVSASGVGNIKRSAFNAVAVDMQPLKNTTKNLADALASAPGLKLRESGGVGS
ncbi:MAG: carboxypeptidase-like regulatory domain-containing protein, partial [Alistipes sp.]|nr:carboxypeptidase-like regulatory domain-containing protein [Alistipes sp.]